MDKSITARRRRSQRDYTLGFKLLVVEQVEKGDLTYKQAQLFLAIRNLQERRYTTQFTHHGKI